MPGGTAASPLPAPAHPAVSGGMPGWQITLIAVGRRRVVHARPGRLALIAAGVALVLAVTVALIVIAVARSGTRPERRPDRNAGRGAAPCAGTVRRLITRRAACTFLRWYSRPNPSPAQPQPWPVLPHLGGWARPPAHQSKPLPRNTP